MKVSVLFRPVLLAVMLFGGVAKAQTDSLAAADSPSLEGLTLEQAIVLALQQNFEIRIARTAEEIALNNGEPGAVGFYPRVTAGGGVNFNLQNRRLQTRTDANGEQVLNRVNNVSSYGYNANVTVQYTVFDGLRRRAFYNRLQSITKASSVQVMQSVETVIANVTRAYYDIVQQQEQQKLLRTALSISEERSRIAVARKEIGAGSGLEALQSTVDLNADKSALLRINGTLQRARVTLNEQMGMPADAAYTIADSTIALDSSLVINELEEMALSRSTALSLLDEARVQADYQIREAKASRLPTLTASLGYNFFQQNSGALAQGFNQNPLFIQTIGPQGGVTLAYTLFDGGNVSRNLQNARIARTTAEYRYQQGLLRLQSDLRRAYVDYQNNLQILALEVENLAVARQNAEVALDRFKIGSSTPLELREAQQTYVQAQTRLLAAQYAAKLAEVELLRLSGRLQDSDLLRPIR